MISRNFRFIFHLYSPDPTLAFPVFDEDGEVDVEFLGNNRDRLANSVIGEIAKIDPNIQIDQSVSTEDELDVHIVFTSESGEYVLDLITDLDNWPQPNESLAKKKMEAITSKELGQRWWIHHLTLPDGSELDCDVINKEAEEIAISQIDTLCV